MSFDGRYSQDDFVLKYICLWAYGYINGFGYSEGVYSSITNLSIGEPDVSKNIRCWLWSWKDGF